MQQKLKFEKFSVKNRKYYISDFKLNENEKNIPHSHDFYELSVVLQGEFTENINEKKYDLSKHFLHFIKPKDSHQMVGENSVNILRNIAVEKNLFENILNGIGVENKEQLFVPFKLNEKTYETYKEKTNLLLQLEYSEKTYIFLVKNIISDLIVCTLLSNTSYSYTKIPGWLQHVHQQMNKNQNYKYGLSYMIKLSGKSQEHFTREFKRYYGLTPSNFINNLRLQQAATLLQTSDLKIIDIIFECGFDNVSYFNRLFKLKYGVIPRNYRDSNKKIFNISM